MMLLLGNSVKSPLLLVSFLLFEGKQREVLQAREGSFCYLKEHIQKWGPVWLGDIHSQYLFICPALHHVSDAESFPPLIITLPWPWVNGKLEWPNESKCSDKPLWVRQVHSCGWGLGGGERIKGVERRKSRGSLPENIFAQPTDLMCNILPQNLSIGGFLKGLGKQPPHSSSMASNCTSSTF